MAKRRKGSWVVGVKRVRVRCLGRWKREHTFLSADPTRERICARCRELTRQAGLSRRAEDGPAEFSCDRERYDE